MRKYLLAILCLGCTMARPALADGLIYQLPDDGAQVMFETEVMLHVNGQQHEGKGSLTVSSVGKTTENGEPCRWIEFKSILPVEGKEHMDITKVLIPEKHLGTGKSPVDNIVRAWKKLDDGEVQQITDFNSPEAAALKVYLGGPPKNPGELKKAEVDGKLGKLECAGVTGMYEIPLIGQLRVNVESRLHEKAPFGMISGNWTFDLEVNGQTPLKGTIKLTLSEVGTTALSQLPDKK